MDQTLKVRIEGDSGGLERETKKAASALEFLQAQTKKAETSLSALTVKSLRTEKAISILEREFKAGRISAERFAISSQSFAASQDRLQNEIKQTEGSLRNLSRLSRAISSPNAGFGAIGKTSGNATNSVLEFNRVIQDAPFGIQGVANNITQLTQSFGQLRAETGSTRAAFKTFLAGFAGPAGILFAVSAVTSALVAYSSSQQGAKNETESAADAINKQKEALNNFISTISDVNKARIQANASAFEELTILNLLRQRAEDVTASQESRNKAVNELQRLYPTYFANASKEDILNGDLKSSYDSLTTSIQNRAKATAALNLLTKNEEESLKLEFQRDKILADIAKKEAQINTLLEKGQNIQSQGANTFIVAAAKQEKQVEELNKELATVTTRIQEIASESTKLSSLIDINDVIEPPEVKEVNDVIEPPEVKEVKEKNPVERFLKVDRNAVLANIFAVTSEAEKTLVGFSQRLSGSIGPDIFSKRFDAANQRLKLSLTNIELALISFNQRATEIVNQGTVNALSGLGQALGQALVSGQNLAEALGASLLSSLGSVLTQLGELAIATGVGLLAVQTALSSLNPAIAIAAGVALVALGSAFSAGAQKLSGQFNSGGSFSGPASNFSSQQSFTPSQSSFDFDREEREEVVFRVDGTSLVGVLNNASRQSRRNGGALRLT